MTGKEALEFIKHSKNIDVISNEIKPLKDTTFKLQLDIIEKDLEVLEILKEYLIITDIRIDNLYNKIYLKEMMNNDIKVIKEWLEKENKNER